MIVLFVLCLVIPNSSLANLVPQDLSIDLESLPAAKILDTLSPNLLDDSVLLDDPNSTDLAECTPDASENSDGNILRRNSVACPTELTKPPVQKIQDNVRPSKMPRPLLDRYKPIMGGHTRKPCRRQTQKVHVSCSGPEVIGNFPGNIETVLNCFPG